MDNQVTLPAKRKTRFPVGAPLLFLAALAKALFDVFYRLVPSLFTLFTASESAPLWRRVLDSCLIQNLFLLLISGATFFAITVLCILLLVRARKKTLTVILILFCVLFAILALLSFFGNLLAPNIFSFGGAYDTVSTEDMGIYEDASSYSDVVSVDDILSSYGESSSSTGEALSLSPAITNDIVSLLANVPRAALILAADTALVTALFCLALVSACNTEKKSRAGKFIKTVFATLAFVLLGISVLYVLACSLPHILGNLLLAVLYAFLLVLFCMFVPFGIFFAPIIAIIAVPVAIFFTLPYPLLVLQTLAWIPVAVWITAPYKKSKEPLEPESKKFIIEVPPAPADESL